MAVVSGNWGGRVRSFLTGGFALVVLLLLGQVLVLFAGVLEVLRAGGELHGPRLEQVTEPGLRLRLQIQEPADRSGELGQHFLPQNVVEYVAGVRVEHVTVAVTLQGRVRPLLDQVVCVSQHHICRLKVLGADVILPVRTLALMPVTGRLDIVVGGALGAIPRPVPVRFLALGLRLFVLLGRRLRLLLLLGVLALPVRYLVLERRHVFVTRVRLFRPHFA